MLNRNSFINGGDKLHLSSEAKLVFAVVIMLVSFLSADITNAQKIRAANWAMKKGDLEKAEQIYAVLPQNKKIIFNRGFLEGLTQKKEDEKKYYKSLLNQNISSKEKARVYFNLGNDVFRQGDIQAAKNYYREGLKLDPQNKKLKNNLELANNAKLMKKSPQQQKDQGSQDKKDQQDKQQQPKSEQQKNAEKMLDSFKEKEQQNQMKMLPKQDKKRNVEKDW